MVRSSFRVGDGEIVGRLLPKPARRPSVQARSPCTAHDTGDEGGGGVLPLRGESALGSPGRLALGD